MSTPINLSARERAILAVLAAHPSPQTLSVQGINARTPAGRAGNTLASLERRGFVTTTRKPGPYGRSTITAAKITADGALALLAHSQGLSNV